MATSPAAGRPRTRAGKATAQAAALSTLLAAHDRSAADGIPLLTDAGLAHVRRLVVATRSGLGGPAVSADSLWLPHWDGVLRQFWLGARCSRSSTNRPRPRSRC
jgi:hypothetical protein